MAKEKAGRRRRSNAAAKEDRAVLLDPRRARSETQTRLRPGRARRKRRAREEAVVEGATRSIEDDPRGDAGGDAGGVKKNARARIRTRARGGAARAARARAAARWAVVAGVTPRAALRAPARSRVAYRRVRVRGARRPLRRGSDAGVVGGAPRSPRSARRARATRARPSGGLCAPSAASRIRSARSARGGRRRSQTPRRGGARAARAGSDLRAGTPNCCRAWRARRGGASRGRVDGDGRRSWLLSGSASTRRSAAGRGRGRRERGARAFDAQGGPVRAEREASAAASTAWGSARAGAVAEGRRGGGRAERLDDA